MDPAKLQALHDEVREVIAALRAGEIARALELLPACEVHELARTGEIPPGADGDALRAAVEEALALAVEMQGERRTAIAQGGTTRRAIGAYGAGTPVPRPRLR